MIISVLDYDFWSLSFSRPITCGLHLLHTLLNQVLFVCVCLYFTSEEDNLQGWFFAEDDGNQIKKQKHPLLLRQMPVVMSKLQEFKVKISFSNM